MKFGLRLMAAFVAALSAAACGSGSCVDCTPPGVTAPTAPSACGHPAATYFLCRDVPNGGEKTPCAQSARIALKDSETITLTVTPGAIAKWDLWAHHAGENGWRIQGEWVDNLKLSFTPPLNPVFAFGIDEINGPKDEWLAGSEDRIPSTGTPQDLIFQASEFNRFNATPSCRTNSVSTRIALKRP